MSALATFTALVNKKIKQDSGKVILSSTDIEGNVLEAVKQYSQRRPRCRLFVGTGDASRLYALPSDWEDGVSQALAIEYPLDSNPPSIVEEDQYVVMLVAEGLRLRFIDAVVPADSEGFWFSYSVRHTVDVSSSTVPSAYEDAVANLAAAISCEEIATFYGNTSDSTLTADVIAYRSRGDEFSSRAKRFREQYNDVVKDAISGVQGDWDAQAYSGAGYSTPLFKSREHF